ncbi:hypothetical protein [Cytobacillus solani]|uniref:hypothetical protein n=1 Tax=Cytobacillus solani TaxID=1637975 RepID=UPI001FDF682B|nr:hypothetical protein [Cytobacillus solani]
MLKLKFYLSEESIVQLRNKLNEIGVLTEGKYDNVIYYTIVNGYWRPLEGSTPFDWRNRENFFLYRM